MVNKIIDLYVKDFSIYHYEKWYWIIHPKTREWIVNVSDSGYSFFNRDFWITFFDFYPSKDMDNDIHNWIVYKFNVPKGNHCYPDYIPYDYNWKDEFYGQKIIDVMNKGELIK